MRALRVGDSGAALAEVGKPEAAGEVVVRVTLSGVCNTDLELARGYMGFRGTLGHEFVGVVDDPGDSGLEHGARVVGEINAGCGTCADCIRGDSRHCPTRTVLGILGRDGAHADFVRLPGRNLIALPDTISDVQAVFVEPLAAAAGILERCPALDPSLPLAIVGDGKLGLLCALALHVRGYAPVLVGKHADKLAIATRRGIETTSIDDVRRRGRAFDTVIEASGHPSGFALATSMLRPRGTLVLKSTFHGTAELDSARVVVEELSIVGSRCGRFAPAIELLGSAAIDVSPLVSATLPLDRANEALALAASPGILKVLLSPG